MSFSLFRGTKALQAQISDLQASLTAAQSDLATAQASAGEIEQLRAQLAERESAHATALEAMTGQIEALRGEIETRETALLTRQTELENRESELSALVDLRAAELLARAGAPPPVPPEDPARAGAIATKGELMAQYRALPAAEKPAFWAKHREQLER